jgi:hypothetical protein
VSLQVNRIYEASTGGNQVLWLYILQRGFSSLQGALNAFAYGFSPGVREAIHAELLLWYRCLRSSGPSHLSRPDAFSASSGRSSKVILGTGGATFAAAHSAPTDFSRMQSIGGGSLDEREFEGAIAMSVLGGSAATPAPVMNPFRTAMESRNTQIMVQPVTPKTTEPVGAPT